MHGIYRVYPEVVFMPPSLVDLVKQGDVSSSLGSGLLRRLECIIISSAPRANM